MPPVYTIRPLRTDETPLLDEFLYQAIFVPEGTLPPPRSITQGEELQLYTRGFGKQAHDHCLVAEVQGQLAGAVWVRIMPDYGHIDDETPSFAISLLPDYRGMGIGTALMQAMLALLRDLGYQRASLAVQKQNYAASMYRKLGFQTVRETDSEYIMCIALSPTGAESTH